VTGKTDANDDPMRALLVVVEETPLVVVYSSNAKILELVDMVTVDNDDG